MFPMQTPVCAPCYSIGIKRSSMRGIFRFASIRYCFAGVTAAAVHLSLLFALVHFAGMWYLAAASIATIFAVVSSFLLQKFWTFQHRDSRRIHVQFFAFAFIALGIVGANALFMYILVEWAGIWYMFAQVISAAVLATINFALYGRLVFTNARSGTMRPHILIATGLYPPDIGGPATYAKLLEDELPRRGFFVSVHSFGEVRRLPKGLRHVLYFFDLMQRATHADIVFALDPVSVGLPAFLVAKILRKGLVLKIVGDYAWEQFVQGHGFVTPEYFQKRRFDPVTELRRKIERAVARRADRVVVPSEYLKKIMMIWGVPEEKIVVIYNSFSPPHIAETKEELRRKLGLSGSAIVSAGRLVPWKGFDTLIGIMPDVAREVPDAKLVLIGDGPLFEDLRFTIKDSGAEATVTLVGAVGHEELLSYLKAADVFVLNTGYEGFSHLLLEAMSVGAPIITTDVGGNPELIESDSTGILVKYNDKDALRASVVSLLKDDKERAALSRKARERAGGFSKERMLDSLVRVFS